MLYGVVKFNGHSSEDYGIHIELLPDYQSPERVYSVYSIPGRNGNVILDQGSYKNVPRRYRISFGKRDGNFVEMANRVIEWLYGPVGYVVLEDSYEPDYYRMAVYSSSTDIVNILGQAGKAVIEFDCKPQRFLKSGTNKITVSNRLTMTNPTTQVALPKIFVYGSGSGTVQVNDCHIKINKVINGMVLDSELRDAYNSDASQNLNGNIELDAKRSFPKLKPGNNQFSYSGSINKIEVIPRWWTL